jgi:non-ribosomal peptide synthetase component F
MEAVAWWKKQFVRLPRPLELPLKRAVPVAGLDPQEGVIAFGLEPEISQALDDLRRGAGATYYMSRLAVMALLAAADTNDPDIILGTYASHRTQMAFRGMIGFFSNPVALRLRCHPQMTFRDWLTRVRDVVVRTAAYSQLPYEDLRHRLSAERTVTPELTVFFSTRHERVAERFAGLDIVYTGRPRVHMPWGFTFECSEQDEETGCCVAFDAGIYDPLRVRGFIERYRRLAAAAMRQPDVPLHRLLSESGLYRVPA